MIVNVDSDESESISNLVEKMGCVSDERMHRTYNPKVVGSIPTSATKSEARATVWALVLSGTKSTAHSADREDFEVGVPTVRLASASFENSLGPRRHSGSNARTSTFGKGPLALRRRRRREWTECSTVVRED